MDSLNNHPQQSNNDDGSIVFFENNSAPISAPLAPKNNSSFPWKKITILVLLFILIVGGSAFGAYKFNTYDKYVNFIETKLLLPNDPNLVISAITNINDQSYKNLETHLQKFPGYSLLIKEIYPDEKDSNMTQLIQKKLDKYGLNLQDEIRPALGDQFIIAIQDLSPLGSQISKKATLTLNSKKSEASSELLAQNNALPVLFPSVLGESTPKKDDSLSKEFIFPKLDFIAASPVNDLDRMQTILNKLKANKQYETKISNYSGFEYYSIKIASSDDKAFENLYSAVIAKNLIISSQEDEMKKAIDRANSHRIVSIKKQAVPSLAENMQFNNVTSKISKEGFLSIYLKLNVTNFLKNKDCQNDCANIDEFLKYPDDLIQVISVKSNEDGIGFNAISNKTNLVNITNKPLPTEMAQKIPENISGQWNDMFSENSNLKELYYDFKNNNLTEKGTKQLNETLDKMKTDIGIDIERELIDQINGTSAFSLYTSKEKEPALLITAKITNEQEMIRTIKTAVETMKQSRLKSLEGMYEMMKQYSAGTNYAAKYKNDIENLKNASFLEKVAYDTTIYSFDSDAFLFGINFAIKNNELIFATNSNAIETVLGANGSFKNIISNQLFQRSMKYNQKNGYSENFFAPQGIVNIATFYLQEMKNKFLEANKKSSSFQTATTSAEVEDPFKEYNDIFTAVGSIIRTTKFVGSSQSVQDNYIQYSLFFDIKELPLEEKEAAESILEKLMAGDKNKENKNEGF